MDNTKNTNITLSIEQALRETIHLWTYLEDNPQLGKCEAIRRTNSPAINYTNTCALCEYTKQLSRRLGEGDRVQCSYCPGFILPEQRCPKPSSHYEAYRAANSKQQALQAVAPNDLQGLTEHQRIKKLAAREIVRICKSQLADFVNRDLPTTA